MPASACSYQGDVYWLLLGAGDAPYVAAWQEYKQEDGTGWQVLGKEAMQGLHAAMKLIFKLPAHLMSLANHKSVAAAVPAPAAALSSCCFVIA